MDKSFTIGTFLGIPLKVHWSFAFTLLFIAYNSVVNHMNVTQTMWFVAIIFALFVCVVLHEYGHAYAAKRFGVLTQDIILSPIGGVARLQSMPEKPKQELIIALAGPLVNVVIALVFSLGVFVFKDSNFLPNSNSEGLVIEGFFDFARVIILLNATLFLFNLTPAFPMDGGRVLRALLAMKMGRNKATKIAALIGRILAIGFIIFGLYNGFIVHSLIGVFIYTMAGAEAKSVNMVEAFGNAVARDIMRTQFTKLHLSDEYEIPIDLYKRNIESNFLVFDSLGCIAGAVPSVFIKKVIQDKDTNRRVSQLMSDKYASVRPDMLLKELYEQMNIQGIAIISVIEHDQVIGVIDRDGIYRYLESASH